MSTHTILSALAVALGLAAPVALAELPAQPRAIAAGYDAALDAPGPQAATIEELVVDAGAPFKVDMSEDVRRLMDGLKASLQAELKQLAEPQPALHSATAAVL